MDGEGGCSLVISFLVLFVFGTCAAWENGYDKGARDASCKARLATAVTAADSLNISRSDSRCALILEKKD